MKNLTLFISAILILSLPLITQSSAVVSKDLSIDKENSILDISKDKSDSESINIEKGASKSNSLDEKSGALDAERKILFKWEEEESGNAKSKEEQKSSIEVQKSKELDAGKSKTEAEIKAQAKKTESEKKLLIEKEHDKSQHRSGHDIGYSETNMDKEKLKVVKDESSSEEKGSLDASAKQDKVELETKSSDSLKAETEKKEIDVRNKEKSASINAAGEESVEAASVSKEINSNENSSLEGSKVSESTDSSQAKGAALNAQSVEVSGVSAEREVIIKQNDRIIHLLEDLNSRLELRAVTR